MKKGTKCTICTGCGRCFGEFKETVNILSFSDACKYRALPDHLPSPVICADIGTTTIAMILISKDLKVMDSYTALNPQGKYGVDVISRIGASSDKDALKDMQNLVLDELKKGINRFAEKIKSEGSGAFPWDMYIAANTTMVYLLMGFDPAELGRAPFTASHTGEQSFDIQLDAFTLNAHVLPGFSAFVGSDIYAGILASDLDSSDEYALLLDLGTNGEIALAGKGRLYVTATAAGPAFEGGPLKGIWGADIIHIASLLLKEKKMDKTGLLSDPYFEEGILAGNVHITQEAIRSLQLAKAAMSAGIKIICDKAGILISDIERCILSGGFGYYLNPYDAQTIKLIPDDISCKCSAGGNTSLSGCIVYAAGKRINKKAEVINLAETPGFNDLYMNSINF